jgi:hypothetical protein
MPIIKASWNASALIAILIMVEVSFANSRVDDGRYRSAISANLRAASR